MQFLRYRSGQTDRHTDTLIAILRTPPGDELKIFMSISLNNVSGNEVDTQTTA